VPAWTVRDLHAGVPATLVDHAPRGIVPLKLMEDGALHAFNGSATSLHWHENEGIVIRRPDTPGHARDRASANHDEEDDESYD